MTQLDFDAATVKALEATYTTPDVVAQRTRVLEFLGLAPGERVLDIGVGPGLLAWDIARLVGPAGRVVGLDLSEPMLAASAARLADFPQASFVRGDATDLGFADASFDAAVSTQVYEYVADMPKALSELRRVLRPGGRAVILDTDWRSIVWHASDPALMDRVLSAWDSHLADPHLPARLGSLLRQAGFEVRRVEVLPMLSPRWQPVSYAAGMMRTIEAYVAGRLDSAGLTTAELEAWRADQEALAARDEFFFSLNRYAFLATC